MAAFDLSEIISGTPSAINRGSATSSQTDESFDARLRIKLEQPGPQPQKNNVDDVQLHLQQSDDITFQTVRNLFRTAATALNLELEQHYDLDTNDDDDDNVSARCHWVPGRIEVMGKHTDYAGGNSLVCATAGRGMAMVSTFISNGNGDESGNGNNHGLKVTIVSVLPSGMEHHATTTAAGYKVEGRTVVHHTIHIPSQGDEQTQEPKQVDWTIYPTTVIHRLHQNFDLFSHCNDKGDTSGSSSSGGHIIIAISSNLPPASGLSTSSAFVTGMFLVLDSHLSLTQSNAYRNAIGDDDSDDDNDSSTVYNLSTYLGNVENGRDYVTADEDVVLEGTVQGGVGTFGGSEDHAAILMGRRSEMRLLSFCPTRPAFFNIDRFDSDSIMLDVNQGKAPETIIQESKVHLSLDLTFVIAYSGAKAEKAGGTDGATDASIGYNSASDLARKAFEAYFMGGDNGGLKCTQTLADAINLERKNIYISGTSSDQSIRASMARRIETGAYVLDQTDSSGKEVHPKELVQRFEHFYDESEYLVPAAAHAISNEKYDILGPIVDASHRGAVNVLKNQIVETAWLPLWARGMEHALRTNPLSVDSASSRDLEQRPESFQSNEDDQQRIKALAASAFGAGFGGSCWALVYRDQAQEFANQWQNAFDNMFPTKESSDGPKREFFLVDPGPGAFCV